MERRGLALFAADPDGTDVGELEPAGAWLLVMGNEGAGVRPDVVERCRAVAVPMAAGVDSLNVGAAAAVLVYAMTRSGGVPSSCRIWIRRHSTIRLTPETRRFTPSSIRIPATTTPTRSTTRSSTPVRQVPRSNL